MEIIITDSLNDGVFNPKLGDVKLEGDVSTGYKLLIKPHNIAAFLSAILLYPKAIISGWYQELITPYNKRRLLLRKPMPHEQAEFKDITEEDILSSPYVEYYPPDTEKIAKALEDLRNQPLEFTFNSKPNITNLPIYALILHITGHYALFMDEDRKFYVVEGVRWE